MAVPSLAGWVVAAWVGLLAPVVDAPTRTTPNDTIARGRAGCVVAAEPLATAVGLEILRAGGNAVDAAVATALALAVTHPQAGNLGGGGFMVIRMADGETAALDFRERAPSGASRNMFLTEDGEVDHDRAQWSALAGGVPGSPAGFVAALERFGSKPLEELAAPAIRLAREGFEVGGFLAQDLDELKGRFARFPSSQQVFWRDGRPLEKGALLVQTDLADTLERFAAEGFDGFYRGETARRFAAAMAEAGGLIDAEDLAAYEVAWREPVRGTYRGYEILSMPPPSSGGIALLEMLNILEGYDLRGAGFGSARALHWTIEAMRRAYADRARWLGDPDHWPVPSDGLVAKDYAEARRATIDPEKVMPVEAGHPAGAKESDDTTHFSVVDSSGNAVSCTTTINSTFGSGLVVAGLGFLLNNEMDDFSAKPGVPNQFGLIGGEANAIRPGKRPLSSMTPTIVLEGGRVRWIVGSPGGGRIINAVLQVLLGCIDYGMSLEEAVHAPRVHQQWRPRHTFWERTALSPDTRAILEGMGHEFAPRSMEIGRCQCIEVRADGVRIGVADPRSGGTALAY